jgi:ubiquitin-conjugating enzyme E2 Z
MSGKDIFISKETIKRLSRDVKDILMNPLDLHNNNIYYKHDEEDILKGYALIVGPKDTIYFGGYYFFEFKFPGNYPHEPPTLKYRTNDGVTRFHPNLYRSGKCCLSILNTWRGEQWTGCQTIKSILLALVMILDEKPLLNEPGINENHRDFKSFNKIVKYKNFEIAILEMLQNSTKFIPKEYNDYFYPYMKENFEKNKKELINILKKYDTRVRRSQIGEPKGKEKGCVLVKTQLYSMSVKTNYPSIYKQIKSITFE